ncbi:HDOD domain-containing protein [Neiella marina]|uniref:HDOD domain-containing protein n=1 Tax=Neiella holothuriorum TaxID=2870530 RepID=A0ABS7ELD9_9GAMM|nr:HDOD domain-containing protein [Neiella holothuriorum]MBW8192698.1 HDOD domain-containing protein [Neiella holothuriorum]
MYIYVARQPIVDVERNLVGYELLFRDSLSNVFPQINAHEATSKLVAGSHLHLGIDEITGDAPAFINFPELSLLVRVPELLPKEGVVIELLEEIEPGPKLVQICKKLKELGYRIALDDFAYKDAWRPVLPYVDMIKVDIRASSPKEVLAIKKLKLDFDIDLLAEKVETHEEFEKFKQMGFRYFQGYFFSRPEVIQRRGLNPSQVNLVELLAKLAQQDCDFSELNSIIQRDVSLTYKLLRFVNSSFFSHQKEISSIKQALVYLGETELRKFLALIAAANLSENKPDELLRLSITRARFCELIAATMNPKHESRAFLAGLFSLIDAILDQPIDVIMEKVPLAQDIKEVTVSRQGPLAPYLNLAVDYERAVWDSIPELSERLGISDKELPEFYQQAIGWSNALLKGTSTAD